MSKSSDIRSFFKQNLSLKIISHKDVVETSSKDESLTSKSSGPDQLQNEHQDLSPKEPIASCSNQGACVIEPVKENTACGDDLGTLEGGACQPRLPSFPKSSFGKQFRCFSSKYYEKYSWLEYSIKRDKVFCFVCRHFTTLGQTEREQRGAFVTTGFNNWRKLSEVLCKHNELSNTHKNCIKSYMAFKASKDRGSVYENVVQQHHEELEINQSYMMKIISVIMYLGRQGLALRGHRENETSCNKGNFLELCELMAQHDPDFAKNFSKHISYCSPKIQNEILEISANLAREEIHKEVIDCGFFSVMVDEARCFKEEQMVVVVRYTKELEVEERFLGFLDCSSARDASGLTNLIWKMLGQYKIGHLPIIAQSHDGASVMSGRHEGVQSKIREKHPQAMYIHCLAHRINLVVTDTCGGIPSAVNFFNAVESLYHHFAKPSNHQLMLQVREALKLNHSEIASLSSTRWACRYHNCDQLVKSYGSIRYALEREIEEKLDKDSVEALGILACVSKPEFIVCLFVFHWLLSILNVLSKYFQSPNATLGRATHIITGTIETIQNSRNDFKLLWDNIAKFSEENDISLDPPKASKKRKPTTSTYLKDSIVDSSLGHGDLPEHSNVSHSSYTIEEYWKVHIYYRVIDSVTACLKKRFKNQDMAESINNFLDLDIDNAKLFIDNYNQCLNIDTNLLQAEALVMKNAINAQGLCTSGTDSTKITENPLKNLRASINKELTPNLYKLLQAAITIPVSSAGCERSFSAMRRVKNWLRTTMGQERFTDLSLLHIERDIFKVKIQSNDVLNKFTKNPRKMKL